MRDGNRSSRCRSRQNVEALVRIFWAGFVVQLVASEPSNLLVGSSAVPGALVATWIAIASDVFRCEPATVVFDQADRSRGTQRVPGFEPDVDGRGSSGFPLPGVVIHAARESVAYQLPVRLGVRAVQLLSHVSNVEQSARSGHWPEFPGSFCGDPGSFCGDDDGRVAGRRCFCSCHCGHFLLFVVEG